MDWLDLIEFCSKNWKKILGLSILIQFIILMLIVFRDPSQNNFEWFIYWIISISLPSEIKFLIFLAEQSTFFVLIGIIFYLYKNNFEIE